MRTQQYTSPKTRNIDQMLQQLYQRRLVVDHLIELLQEYSRSAPAELPARMGPSSSPGPLARGERVASPAQ